MDWSDAYDNTSHIADGPLYPARWARRAAEFRERAGSSARFDRPYGPQPRQRFDLFLPAGTPRGLVVFVHGGYWRAFDKSIWSHLAEGAVKAGWATALPSYTLAPQARIAAITRGIAQAVAAAASEVDGPIRLAGHSAGGHLVTRLVCADAPLPESLRARICHVVSISGLHDLRPLLKTALNATLRLDPDEARRESPALLEPDGAASVTCWVGGAERPEFLRQTQLLANVWFGCGATIAAHVEPGRHHFDVCDDLVDPRSLLTRTLLGEPA